MGLNLKPITYNELKANIEAEMKLIPALRNFVDNDVHKYILDTFAGLTDLITTYIQQAYDESYLSSASSRSAVVGLATNLGYDIPRPLPSQGYVQIEVTYPYDKENRQDMYIVIPKGTLLNNDFDVQFITCQETIICLPANLKKVQSRIIPVVAGTIKTVTFPVVNETINAPFQIYYIDDATFSDYYGAEKDHYRFCSVYSVQDGNTNTPPRRYEISRKSFFDSNIQFAPRDRVIIRTSPLSEEAKGVEIIFGDDIVTAVRSPNHTTLICEYLAVSSTTVQGDTSWDFVAKSEIPLPDPDIEMEVLNCVPIMQGEDVPTIDSIKYNSQSEYLNTSIITREDIKRYLQHTNSIKRFKNVMSWGEKEELENIQEYFNIANEVPSDVNARRDGIDRVVNGEYVGFFGAIRQFSNYVFISVSSEMYQLDPFKILSPNFVSYVYPALYPSQNLVSLFLLQNDPRIYGRENINWVLKKAVGDISVTFMSKEGVGGGAFADMFICRYDNSMTTKLSYNINVPYYDRDIEYSVCREVDKNTPINMWEEKGIKGVTAEGGGLPTGYAVAKNAVVPFTAELTLFRKEEGILTEEFNSLANYTYPGSSYYPIFRPYSKAHFGELSAEYLFEWEKQRPSERRFYTILDIFMADLEVFLNQVVKADINKASKVLFSVNIEGYDKGNISQIVMGLEKSVVGGNKAKIQRGSDIQDMLRYLYGIWRLSSQVVLYAGGKFPLSTKVTYMSAESEGISEQKMSCVITVVPDEIISGTGGVWVVFKRVSISDTKRTIRAEVDRANGDDISQWRIWVPYQGNYNGGGGIPIRPSNSTDIQKAYDTLNERTQRGDTLSNVEKELMEYYKSILKGWEDDIAAYEQLAGKKATEIVESTTTINGICPGFDSLSDLERRLSDARLCRQVWEWKDNKAVSIPLMPTFVINVNMSSSEYDAFSLKIGTPFGDIIKATQGNGADLVNPFAGVLVEDKESQAGIIEIAENIFNFPPVSMGTDTQSRECGIYSTVLDLLKEDMIGKMPPNYNVAWVAALYEQYVIRITLTKIEFSQSLVLTDIHRNVTAFVKEKQDFGRLVTISELTSVVNTTESFNAGTHVYIDIEPRCDSYSSGFSMDRALGDNGYVTVFFRDYTRVLDAYDEKVVHDQVKLVKALIYKGLGISYHITILKNKEFKCDPLVDGYPPYMWDEVIADGDEWMYDSVVQKISVGDYFTLWEDAWVMTEKRFLFKIVQLFYRAQYDPMFRLDVPIWADSQGNFVETEAEVYETKIFNTKVMVMDGVAYTNMWSVGGIDFCKSMAFYRMITEIHHDVSCGISMAYLQQPTLDFANIIPIYGVEVVNGGGVDEHWYNNGR